MTMDDKLISAYQIKDEIFIQAYSKTVSGINKLDGKVFRAFKENTEDLGKNILMAFGECRTGIPDLVPKLYNANDSLLIKETKMKNWSSLQKLSLSVLIKKKADLVKFTPKKFMGNTGPNRGYEWLEDKAIETEDLSPENLGRCLVEALARSEPPFLKV